MNRFLLVIGMVCCSLMGRGGFDLSPNAEISILTCSPGNEIYSIYGHSAIRLTDMIDGQRVDVVYNYGTFEFDDDFAFKFTMGRLNYMLSRSDWPYFLYEYTVTGRGIQAQVLDLSSEEKQVLIDLLEENYLPENREYLYDFFHDNCSTRIRDQLQKALGGELVWHPSDSGRISFRQMVDPYQDVLPWTHFGIDLGLASPSDERLGPLDDMFLPDYLFGQLARAELHGRPLVGETVEILPDVVPEEESTWWTPVVFFWCLFIGVVLALIFGGSHLANALSTTFLFLAGFLGLLLFLLWVATDHVATVVNYNILWLWPTHVVMVWIKGKTTEKYWWIHTIIIVLCILTQPVIPQEFPAGSLPLMLLLLTLGLTRTSLGKRLLNL
ncbi:MAG: DUF4105 domain-containing protein [Flavobacteriales bacterium]|nr:DUF4105 domain-containing protein [Flavobacteriales bacterium]